MGRLSATLDATGWGALEKAVQKTYPDLRLVGTAPFAVFRGSFPIVHEGEVLDRFQVEMNFLEGAERPPRIYEIGGRIPRVADRHVFSNGSICTEVPELTLIRGYSLPSYLDGPVRNYFLWQLLFERGEEWPHGDRPHNKPGLLDAYGEVLGVSGEEAIRRYLDMLSHEQVKGHWPCPCGSEEKLRRCHIAEIRTLQASITPAIAKQALAKLDFFSRTQSK